MADIAVCVSVLKQMQPSDLTLPRYAAVLEARDSMEVVQNFRAFWFFVGC